MVSERFVGKKLCGLVGVPLVLMTFVSVSSASSGFGSTQTLVLLAVAVVLSASLAFVDRASAEGRRSRRSSSGWRRSRSAAKGNLVNGLNALSVGDLTVEAARQRRRR